VHLHMHKQFTVEHAASEYLGGLTYSKQSVVFETSLTPDTPQDACQD